MAISVKIPETIIYNNPDLGMEGKNLTWKKKSEIRKEASKSIKENHEIHEDYKRLVQQLNNHEIVDIRDTIVKTISSVKRGLQETYDVIFEELLLLKDKLEKDIWFIEKHVSEIDKKDLDIYRYELLAKMKVTIDNLEALYISDVIEAINKKDFAKFKIETIPDEKFLRMIKERISIKMLFDRTYSEERRLARLDEHKKAGKRINKIISENKAYYDDFEKIADKILLHNLVIIKRADNMVDGIETAIENYDLIPSYSEFSNELKSVLQEEINALKNLKKSISQIRALIKKADKALDKAQDKRLEESNAA